MDGIKRLCEKLGLWRKVIIPVSNKSLSEQLSDDNDEFVHRTAYEKLESELEVSHAESVNTQEKISGLENLVAFLQKDKERLLKEVESLSESLGRVSVELAKLKQNEGEMKHLMITLKGVKSLDNKYFSKIVDESFPDLI